MKTALIAGRLIRQNRWLWLLLLVWPWGMAAVLLAGGHPAPEDAAGLLVQECWYGLALAAFTAGSALGNEERSRRIALVLSRAVTRGEYLLALWLTAVGPLLGYAVCCLAAGLLMGADDAVAVRLCCAMTALGAAVASLSLLASVYLPGVVASGLGLLLLSGLYWVPPEALAVAALVRGMVAGGSLPPLGMAEALALAGIVLGLAVCAFRGRNLRLREE